MLETESPSKAFLGVRFVLFGFDPADERTVRSKLIDGGGVEDSQYCQSCTHVIVDKIVFEDPVCVAARNDGKTLVTGLWVDHSYDIGMPVDASSVMYRPLRDLKGIPGANNLIVCLTGYQRQDRDDIMTMVGLMGAQFSKPLVANRVTHLICYKFEGEKYELAKKMKKIKLINHQWLEDCLREWELLPEDDYSKSSYELETMEAEAKDSEEEAEETKSKQYGVKSIRRSPHSGKVGITTAREMSKAAMEVTNATEPADSSKANDIMLPLSNVKGSYPVSSFNSVVVPQVDGPKKDAISVEFPVHYEKSPHSASDEGTVFRDANFSAKGYSKKTQGQSPRKSRMPMLSGGTSAHISGSPEGATAKKGVVISSPKIQHSRDLLGFGFVESSEKGASVGPSCKAKSLHHEEVSAGLLPQKRMIDSASNSKSQKMNRNSKAGIMGNLALSYGNLGLKNDLSSFITENSRIELNENADEKSPHTYLKGLKESTATKLDAGNLGLKNDLASLLAETSEHMQNEVAEQRSPETCFKVLKESTPGRKFNLGSSGTVTTASVEKAGDAQSKQQNFDVSSSDGKSPMETSYSPPNRELLDGGCDRLVEKPLARKTLGTRPKLSTIAKKNDSICSDNMAATNDNAVCLISNTGRLTCDNAICSSGDGERLTHAIVSKLEISPPTVSKVAGKEVMAELVNISRDDGARKIGFVDEATKSLDEKDEPDNMKSLDEGRSDLLELTHKADNVEINHVNSGLEGNEHMGVISSGTAGNNSKSKGVRSVSRGNSTKGVGSKMKKQVACKTKAKTVHVGLKRDSDRRASQNRKKSEEEGNEKENSLPDIEINNNNMSDTMLGNSMKVEKRPVDIDQGMSISKTVTGTAELKPNRTSVKSTKSSKRMNSNSVPDNEVASRVKTEPSCFIVSGHRLQRKEFRKVIRDLKGRFCRDSHQWSYQATHFIAPDPLRRTEKFFAAAASGRWILKTDYLSACNEAGRFLPEEPYEWHKNGLSEDGAINLEAPRKWRLLRQKTSHGALHGMHIIIYGECIAPPLDTLKRVVKAGDGTILATSPPYTRFLKSGVDFAIVSPGMPRVDLWVQEFLKHEIPCVVADYLVEYVCKPGYPLERHVLYNTHAWAEKSFANLTSKAEEVAEDMTPSEDCGSDDIACQVCGSCDREEVMLICGDESGSAGCGIGIHIECCDPPLSDVPSGDWFCSNCSKSSKSPTPSKKRRKGPSSAKNK